MTELLAAARREPAGGGAEAMAEIRGFTVSRFIVEYNSTPIGAFLNLDWLMHDPEEALAAFAEGYDHVIPPLKK